MDATALQALSLVVNIKEAMENSWAYCHLLDTIEQESTMEDDEFDAILTSIDQAETPMELLAIASDLEGYLV